MVTSDADYAATAVAHGVGTDAAVGGDPDLSLALTLLADAIDE